MLIASKFLTVSDVFNQFQFANETDVGEYVCEVSSYPPATLRHHVSLIGNDDAHLGWYV